MNSPSIGRIVHYVDKNLVCNAAIITRVPVTLESDGQQGKVSLYVITEYSTQSRAGVPYSEENNAESWHWPERV